VILRRAIGSITVAGMSDAAVRGASRWQSAPIRRASTLIAVTILAGIAWVCGGPDFVLLPLLYLAVVTPRLCVVDVAEHRLPNRLVLPGYPIALLAVLAAWVLAERSPLLSVSAGAGYFLFLLILSLIGGVGMGDVKLAGVLGVTLGLVSTSAALTGPLLGFLFGGFASAVLLIAGKAGRRSRIPFGPFMLAGFWVAVLGSVVLGERS
jgi:leader peptidase (prepilin peptidase)/N-methyltransferase